MTNGIRNFLSAVGVVVVSAMLMGAKTLYDDHNLNTQHRLAAQEVIGYIVDTRKDVCLIKAHLKGIELPDCDVSK